MRIYLSKKSKGRLSRDDEAAKIDQQKRLSPNQYRRRMSLSMVPVLGSIIIMVKIASSPTQAVQIHVNASTPVHIVNEKFLSFGIDASYMEKKESKISFDDWNEMAILAGTMAPAYMRLGGTAADRTVFKKKCLVEKKDKICMSIEKWEQFNNFVNESKLKLLFDLNVLIRNHRNEWSSKNAKFLLDVSKSRNYSIDFQLGNEPNSFAHIFNRTVAPIELSKDYKRLHKILKFDKYFEHSKLVGPEVTNPEKLKFPSGYYLTIFLQNTPHILDAVTWHQYYLNGRNASVNDFLDPKVMNNLLLEIQSIKQIVSKNSNYSKVWLSETGSAFGGGAPNLSDTYVSIFLFLDKLGTSAREGIDLIIRQSFIGGNYGLIDSNFNPNPDFWVALLYKQLVGTYVYDTITVPDESLRFYAHSAKLSLNCLGAEKTPSVVIFGLNLSNKSKQVELDNFEFGKICQSYLFTADENIQSRRILLNSQILQWAEVKNHPMRYYIHYAKTENLKILPPQSVGFWVF